MTCIRRRERRGSRRNIFSATPRTKFRSHSHDAVIRVYDEAGKGDRNGLSERWIPGEDLDRDDWKPASRD
ncbi:MAG: hypothetical protein DMF07_09565 [Verrucomicrobia bacterium]|nr:MAG: hypothetical protein DMF07_09565 [Verrucomicrobiota bacterium]